MSRNTGRFVTITEEHRKTLMVTVGFDGRRYPLSAALGRVQRCDVGKRAYLIEVDNGLGFIIQVENDQQRAARDTSGLSSGSTPGKETRS